MSRSPKYPDLPLQRRVWEYGGNSGVGPWIHPLVVTTLSGINAFANERHGANTNWTEYEASPMIQYFRAGTYEHEWLAFAHGLYLYVLKLSDRWTSGLPDYTYKTMKPVDGKDVPVEIRRKAGQRLGAHRANQRIM